MRTVPSISGASPSLRAMAVLPSTASTSTRIFRPTFAASFAALIPADFCMKRASRSSWIAG
jgi:hypothetical protein